MHFNILTNDKPQSLDFEEFKNYVLQEYSEGYKVIYIPIKFNKMCVSIINPKKWKANDCRVCWIRDDRMAIENSILSYKQHYIYINDIKFKITPSTSCFNIMSFDLEH